MGRKIGDYPIDELWKYRPELTNKPDDFWDFWDKEKGKLDQRQEDVHVTWRDYPVPTVEVADLLLTSWDGTPLKGLFVKPKQMVKGPVMIGFHGYTGTRGLPVDYLKWTAIGVAIVIFDVRGQSESPDYARYENGSRVPGWMLNGIYDREQYYFTNVYRDVLSQLNWVRSGAFPMHVTKLGAMGGSQGGGLSLVAAGLDQKLDFVLSDYPFLAHFERALEIALSGPYMEFTTFLSGMIHSMKPIIKSSVHWAILIVSIFVIVFHVKH
nr:acetylxylan esterase [Ornithinibacillus scapharcae]